MNILPNWQGTRIKALATKFLDLICTAAGKPPNEDLIASTKKNTPFSEESAAELKSVIAASSLNAIPDHTSALLVNPLSQ